MQIFLITNGPLIPTILRERPVANQDQHISNKEQLAASVQLLENQQKSALELYLV